MNTSYNKETIDAYHDGIEKRLISIDEQVKCTNGRVHALERWKSYILGGFAVMSVLVIPVFLYVIKTNL